MKLSTRTLPVYPGVIPYRTDEHDSPRIKDNSPKLLALEPRPASTTMEKIINEEIPNGTVISKLDLTKDDIRNHYYEYWESQQRQNPWLEKNGGQKSEDGVLSSGCNQSGSQAALLEAGKQNPRWPKGSGFLFTSWAFTLSMHSIWSLPVAVIESSLGQIIHGWFWAGIMFVLIVLVTTSSLFGYLEVIASSVIAQKPTMIPYKPVINFAVLVSIFLLALLMATQGGIHVYHLLNTYISYWPTLLFSLLTVISATWCHGTKHLLRNLSTMSKLDLPHWISSHLSVLYSTVIPAMLMGSLGWNLMELSQEQEKTPLANFSMTLPLKWGMPLGWSLALLPLSPIILGAIIHIAWNDRMISKLVLLRRSVKPTEQWYNKERNELVIQKVIDKSSLSSNKSIQIQKPK